MSPNIQLVFVPIFRKLLLLLFEVINLSNKNGKSCESISLDIYGYLYADKNIDFSLDLSSK